MGRRIDVHFHIIPDFYKEAAHEAGAAPAIGRYPAWSPELALKLMDANEIDVALTSVSQPGVHFGEPEKAWRLARKCNDYAADVAFAHSGRFGSFALVPMQNADHAIAELDHCFDQLNFAGACLFASYGDKFLGDPAFDPVMESLNQRGAAVFVHPNYHPSSKALELPWPGFMMEFVFDTTRAAANMLWNGTLDRYPRIRFILSHAGGVLPYLAWRLSVTSMIDQRLPRLSQEDVYRQLARYWYDTAIAAGDQTLGALTKVAREDRIVFGSDWPYCSAEVVEAEVRDLARAQALSAAARAAIDRSNALQLFPHLA